MEKVFQVVYKGMYTNAIKVTNYNNVIDYEKAVEQIKNSERLILICTNIANVEL